MMNFHDLFDPLKGEMLKLPILDLNAFNPPYAVQGKSQMFPFLCHYVSLRD